MVKKYYRHIIEADNFLFVTNGTTNYNLNTVSDQNNHSGFVIYLERQEAFTTLSEFLTYMDSAYVNERRFNTQYLLTDYSYYKLWCIFTRKGQLYSSSTDKRTNVSNNNISCNFILAKSKTVDGKYFNACVLNPNFNSTKSSFDLKRIAEEKYITSYTAFERVSNGYIGAYIYSGCTNFTDNITFDNFDESVYPLIIKEKIRSRKIVSHEKDDSSNSYKHQAELFANEATGQNILPLKIYEQSFIDSNLGSKLDKSNGELQLKSADNTLLSSIQYGPFRNIPTKALVTDKKVDGNYSHTRIARTASSPVIYPKSSPEWFNYFYTDGTAPWDINRGKKPIMVVVQIKGHEFKPEYYEATTGVTLNYIKDTLCFIVYPCYALLGTVPTPIIDWPTTSPVSRGLYWESVSEASCGKYILEVNAEFSTQAYSPYTSYTGMADYWISLRTNDESKFDENDTITVYYHELY